MGGMIKILLIGLLSISLIACKSIQHAFVVNETNESIHVEILFTTIYGDQILETDIPKNDSDGWQYEVSRKDVERLDQNLTGIVIRKHNGCEIKITREELLNIAKKSGSWVITIDDSILDCE